MVIRYFDGKRYESGISFGGKQKQQAEDYARRIRSHGILARVIRHEYKTHTRWDVYEHVPENVKNRR